MNHKITDKNAQSSKDSQFSKTSNSLNTETESLLHLQSLFTVSVVSLVRNFWESSHRKPFREGGGVADLEMFNRKPKRGTWKAQRGGMYGGTPKYDATC